MGKNRTGRRAYVGLEPGLAEANRKNYVSCNKKLTHQAKHKVEQIVRKVINAMKQQSPTFAKMYVRNFGGGSIYDGLKIGTADEFDIDILLQIPEVAKPVLEEDEVAGFAQLQLVNFQDLLIKNPEIHKEMSKFVDDKNYLLPKKMKSSFMQSIFDKTIYNQFPQGSVKIGNMTYNITRVQHQGPALTLTLDGPLLSQVAVDLVPSILLGKEFWPAIGRRNPYSSSKLQEFFLAPTTPKQQHPHRERFWRLSFHIQEREIIFDRFLMKPTIRVLKRLRDHFHHSVRSYAIKTIFLWELSLENPNLDATLLFWKGPLSFTVVYMLEKYLQCLMKREIQDFWNPKLNLLCHLSEQQLEQYGKDVSGMVMDIKRNPAAETLLKYLI